jgi:hypothetical protein
LKEGQGTHFVQGDVGREAESVARATERLKRRNDRTDFSYLMQALLEAWLGPPE